MVLGYLNENRPRTKMEVLGHALRDARMELDTLRSVSAGLEYDVRAYEVTLNRFEEKYKMLGPAAGAVESERGTRHPEGLSLSWELANIATGSAWTVAGLLDGVRCLRRGVLLAIQKARQSQPGMHREQSYEKDEYESIV
ncbi:uncharacterized protein STEHIDRAFT_156188 [Stereum hirsutum FP-91666 SS1]|uniref:uncharacterized protein n=1 Tax=Stereum hirsutum (strain FP-91666) TaxID=721885 RepID=UPI000440EA65|nr:uncharacterized protein STEHIDRAFT_156188 [Stereum hirsutum FP-91666 SS1]EIM87199.1 hypothetical protein STEHIDRAFT_156188 [Stereum hirsutum FP-91666 SS1]